MGRSKEKESGCTDPVRLDRVDRADPRVRDHRGLHPRDDVPDARARQRRRPGLRRFGIPWWVQFLVAAIVAVVLIFTLRPPLLRRLRRGGDPARSNIDALIGADGAVVSTVTQNGGQVRLQNGETWTARLSPITEQRDVAVGEKVLVTGIDGATAVVVPVERSAAS